MTPKDIRNHVAASCGYKGTGHEPMNLKFPERRPFPVTDNQYEIVRQFNKAQQGEPTSFSAWLEANQDSIEPLDRTEATAQWFDDKAQLEIDYDLGVDGVPYGD